MENSISENQLVDTNGKAIINSKELVVQRSYWNNIKYLVVGVSVGIVFVKAEIISWFRM